MSRFDFERDEEQGMFTNNQLWGLWLALIVSMAISNGYIAWAINSVHVSFLLAIASVWLVVFAAIYLRLEMD